MACSPASVRQPSSRNNSILAPPFLTDLLRQHFLGPVDLGFHGLLRPAAEGCRLGGGVPFQQHQAAGGTVWLPHPEDLLPQGLPARCIEDQLLRVGAGRGTFQRKDIVPGMFTRRTQALRR